MTMARVRRLEQIGRLAETCSVDVPVPRAGELLLGIQAVSLNYHDLLGLQGNVPNVKMPRVPCSDASAVVLGIGEGVTLFAPGDAVIPAFFPNWRSGKVSQAKVKTILGDQIDGTLQTHLCVRETAVARAPAGLPHEEIATLGCAGLTAWRSIVVEGRVTPGQTILLQGTGGVSLFALGFAKMCGARVVITSSSDEKLARAKELGADVLINYRTTPNWADAVLEETGGIGADLVVEVAGGATLAHSIHAVRTGGHVSVIGVLTGYEAAQFPLALVMAKNATVRGITVGSVEDLDAMCRAIEQKAYRPLVSQVFDLDDAETAFEQLQKQAHFGKIAIRLG